MDYKNILSYLAIKNQGDWDMIFKNLQSITMEDRAYAEYCTNSLSCKVITYLDEEYPVALRNIMRPPFALFYYGDISLIKNTNNCLAVVGSREPSSKALINTDKVISGLSKDIVVVSGMAKGIDAAAQWSAIKSGLKTVAVLGTGIDTCYPTENIDLYNKLKESYLIISEYPPGVHPDIKHFPVRNRIVSGLSKAVLIPEAHIRSGTSSTATFALEQNRDICCIPGEIETNSLCNQLIKQGAALVENGEDVMDVMSFGKLLFSLK